MKVVKRNGKQTELNISKIRNVVRWACSGLTNPLALEAHLSTRIKDGITTREIQDNLINGATTLCTPNEPDWRYVAGRLQIWSLWKDVDVSRGFGYGNYFKSVVRKLKEGFYEGLDTDYTNDELEEAGNWINAELDKDYDYAGVLQLIQKYLLKDELPQEAFLTCSLLLAAKEKEKMKYAKIFYDAISQRKISLATPILGNLRLPNASLTSCFIDATDDTLKSIYQVISNLAEISKNSGGSGINFSRVRAQGSTLMGRVGASNGIIPFIKVANDTAVAVNQGGRRAGSTTIAIDVWHLDILEFLDMQTEHGDQRRKCYDVFPQIVISDEFMRRSKANQDWFLFDPYEIRMTYKVELAELWGESFEKFYCKLEKDVAKGKIKLFKKINAKELIKIMMRSQLETGMPYIAFKDTINRANPNQHTGYIPNVNLCVHPDTLLLTDKGELPIETLDGMFINAWNGVRWSEVLVKKTRQNSPLILVTLQQKIDFNFYEKRKVQRNVELKCTPDHRFILGDSTIVTAKELLEGTILRSYTTETGHFYHTSVVSVKEISEISDVYCANEQYLHQLVFNGVLTMNCTESFSNVKPGVEAHCCNLVSLNLANINDFDELATLSQIAVRLLDNTIDITKPPIPEAKTHNELYRTIGIGTMGLADWLAKRKLKYTSLKEINELYEIVAYNCITESVNLAKERGAYKAYKGSLWDKGYLMNGLTVDELDTDNIAAWEILAGKIQQYGIRNSQLTAIAPNTSSALVQGCTSSVLPVFSKFFYDKWGKATVPIAPPFINDYAWFYQENKHLDQKKVIDAMSIIQKWIDTGISMELLFNLNPDVYEIGKEITARDIYEAIVYAWEKGCKTIYYIRTIQKDEFKKHDNDCVSCAN